MRYARQVVSSVVSLALPMADVTAAALVEVLHRLIQVVAVLWDHMAGTVVDTHVAVPSVGWVVVLRRKQRMSRSFLTCPNSTGISHGAASRNIKITGISTPVATEEVTTPVTGVVAGNIDMWKITRAYIPCSC
jgi:hypothetical protein